MRGCSSACSSGWLAEVSGSVTELRTYLRTRRDVSLAVDALLPFLEHPEAEGLHDEIVDVADEQQTVRRLSLGFPRAHRWSAVRRWPSALRERCLPSIP